MFSHNKASPSHSFALPYCGCARTNRKQPRKIIWVWPIVADYLHVGCWAIGKSSSVMPARTNRVTDAIFVFVRGCRPFPCFAWLAPLSWCLFFVIGATFCFRVPFYLFLCCPFCFVLECTMTPLRRKSQGGQWRINIASKFLCESGFADDIMLMSSDPRHLEQMIREFCDASLTVGL